MIRAPRITLLILFFTALLLPDTIGSHRILPCSDAPSLLYETIDYQNETPPSYLVFRKALTGYYHLRNLQSIKTPVLTIIDFTKPSHVKRLWVIDIEKRKLLFHCLTSHGKNSGEGMANSFSNIHNSNKSSLGFFITGTTYTGKHGMSLKLKGIEPGINDQAEARAIVMHSADYVSEAHIKKYGRLGRSFGCPALPPELHEKIISAVANGSCLFIYHSNKDYAAESVFSKLDVPNVQ